MYLKKMYFILYLCLSTLIGGIIGIIVIQNIHKRNNEIINPNGIPMNQVGLPMEELKKLVIEKGDNNAYENLRIRYLDVKKYESEFLIYSLYMANKYDNKYAYYDVYKSMTRLFGNNKIDERSKELAIEYLKKGVLHNEYRAVYELSQLLLNGKYVRKDILLGKELEQKADSLW
jgi:hypothetical protein